MWNGFLDDSVDSSNSNNSLGRTFDSSSPENGLALQESVTKLQKELVLSREALTALKLDRKRLKSEKCELLNQMKEVYSTLEGKERELRDFIRQYEQRMKDSDKGLRELIIEKEKADEERNKFVASLQDAETKVGVLKDNLCTKDADINRLQSQLKELQGRFLLLTGHKPILPNSSSVQTSLSGGTNSSSMHTPSTGYGSMPLSPAENLNVETDPGKLPTSVSAYCNRPQNNDSQEPTDPVIVPRRAEPVASKVLMENRPWDDGGDSAEVVQVKMRNRPRNRSSKHRQSASSDRSRLSKIFGLGSRSKTRDLSDVESVSSPVSSSASNRRASVLGLPSTPPEDPIAADLSLAEKAEKLLEARQMSLVRWKQAHVLAWIELELGMGPQHIQAFTENVKSGKVLLGLTDHDLENTLGLVRPMYKKKLRLAIEEYRVPSLCKFPSVREVTWQYVASHFLPACGLSQFSEKFKTNLVDGRVLSCVNKKQLEKYLGISKKFYQLSLLKGVELLRHFKFDVKALAKRRTECDRKSTDLLVWTNDKLKKWIEQIDLQEYGKNLHDSGIHGALAVLEPSFSVETLATALGIPTNRQMVRKHLSSEFTTLLLEARSRLANQVYTPRSQNKSSGSSCDPGGSLGRAFTRSYSPTKGLILLSEQDSTTSTPKKRSGFRGDALSQSADSAISTDNEHSPPNRVTPACGVTIKMRSKSTGRVPGLGCGIRPHSIADFSPIQKSANRLVNHVNMNRSTFEPECPLLVSPERLQNWLSVDDFKQQPENSNSEETGELQSARPSTPPLERRIGTISEQAEPEFEGEMMEHKPIGSTAGVWRSQETRNKSITDENSPSPRRVRPQSLLVTYLEDFCENLDPLAYGGRGRCRNKRKMPQGEPPIAKIDLQETDL